MWFTHEVELSGVEVRTARGVTRGDPTTIKASVNAASTKVTATSGEEVVAAATVCWSMREGVPEVGRKLTLPPAFGLKGERDIITARLAYSGTGLTPDHVEVTVK